MSRENTSLLRMDDDGDPWGTAMSHAFAIAEALHHRQYTSWENENAANYALMQWRFRHSPVSDGPECSEFAAWPCDEYRRWSTRRLIRTGRVINRYLDLLVRHGKDY